MRNIQTFEVRVKVRQKGSMHFSSHVGEYIDNTVVKMFHIDAKTHIQALQRAEKHGRPLSVRKADVEKMERSIENCLLIEPYGASNPYPNAIAMEEMVWKQKVKRGERIHNSGRDKVSH